MAKGVLVCEGEFEGVVTKRSAALLQAYSDGFRAGADKYGAGHATVYTRADLGILRQANRSKIVEMIEKHLPE